MLLDNNNILIVASKMARPNLSHVFISIKILKNVYYFQDFKKIIIISKIYS